jgi:amidase
MADALGALDATGQAELVRSRTASPTELVEAAIARVEALDDRLNAVIHRRFQAALAEAGALTERVAGPGGDDGGPGASFAGVPILLKDLGAPMAGEPHYAGTAFARDAGFRSPHDSFIVEKLRAAGFVVLGRTNCPELGTTITTEPMTYGPTRNPWATERTTGGSSGGSAAAVASGMVAVAHANDGGGSIRIPASNCGLVGLKPSRGRVSPGPDPSEAAWAGSTIDHVLTRTVRDSAALLDVLSGEMPGDLFVAPPPPRPFAQAVSADPGPLRVAYWDAPALEHLGIDPECASAVRDAATALEQLGHATERARPDALCDPTFEDHFLVLVTTAVVADLAAWSEALGRTVEVAELEPANQIFAALGAGHDGAAYLRAVLWCETWRRHMASFFAPGGYDLLVTPVLAYPPARIGELTDPEHGLERVLATLQYTAQFNVSGQPAVSLPLHWSADGLPVGVQLVAAYGREDLLLSVAARLEEAHPWSARIPPVHA